MFVLFLMLSIVIFIAFEGYALLNRKKQVKALSIALIGIILATAFLVFPLFEETDAATDLIKTLFYSLKIPGMSGDFDILENAPKNLFIFFEVMLYIYALLAPLLTAGVIVSFISTKMDEVRARMKTTKTVHIFSEINEKSVMLFESLKQEDNIIIFCDRNDKKEYHERIKRKNGIILKKDILNMNFKKYLGEIRIYEISDNEDLNLKRTLEIINAKKEDSKNLTVYLFTTLEEAQIILDSTDKREIKTIIINEIQQMVYQILEEKPLYENVVDGKINVLIAGSGRVGTEFIKSITWCGQMIGYDLEIHVIDQNANEIEQELLWRCPELKRPNYNIFFHQAKINSEDTRNILEKDCPNTNYVIVALGEDGLNLDVAISLRRHYLKYNKQPIIGLVTQNKEKKQEIEYLKNEKGESYHFYPFGCLEELYGKKNILNEKIELLAQKIHLSYSPDDTLLKGYYKNEYNKKSSRASALHLKYKLYSLFGREEVTLEELEEVLKQDGVEDVLARNEHARWNAYMRSDGYSIATVEDVASYYKEVDNHVHRMAKLHPGLVKFDDLDKVSKQLKEKLGIDKNLKNSDYDIVRAMSKILEEELPRKEKQNG